jgi:hypothetical protein
LECRLPDALPVAKEECARVVTECSRKLITLANQQGVTPLRFYCETILDPDRMEQTIAIVEGLAYTFTISWPKPAGALVPGFKVRCGGNTAKAVPSPSLLRSLIALCNYFQVPLKFTAGLHHSLRHFDDATKTSMHGFLNIFTAGVLVHTRFLTGDAIQLVIEDEEATDFRFDENTMQWRNVRPVTIDEIQTARRNVVTSFGSCSFDEPRDGLRALGLIP